ncbi:hypothetical protein [Streptomyces lancefieldiae]|uniref:Integral membrane protein n=1 Tax=Streptomyces lancefieldiae TaxID=3075520 RepID=A0ABU3AW11_9ACTN|nr:hypothetical protein [Streptomyces sp. DSM 40712]MDT0614103.1 hypothetical protein [Streptomyces sp. DSM 40712]
MRNTRSLAAVGAAVAVLGLTAPTATAGADHTPSNIVALPSTVARGGLMTVTVDGCPQGGTMTSDAFRTTSLTPVAGANDTSRGTTTIRQDARPGSYDITVTVNCSGRRLTRPAAFTVIGGVRAGVGGSSSGRATRADLAIGAGLVAAAVACGGLFWVRRRAERRF